MEQILEIRDVYVAFMEERFVGYLTICWTPSYEPFRKEKIPEMVDDNLSQERFKEIREQLRGWKGRWVVDPR